MFTIKICGVTSVADAIAAAACGANAIGVNFYPHSRRYVCPPDAATLLSSIPSSAAKVGVFVNAQAVEINNVAEHVALDCIQLHGDEPASLLAQLPPNLPIVRAFRYGSNGLAPLAAYLDQCCENNRLPDAVLIDADSRDASEFGGTGRTTDWARLAEERDQLGDIPLILAGGLTPQNVADAIIAVQPNGVDVASGVECAPARKDLTLMRDFVAAARGAFERI